jgi:carbohydrate-selective porin OprB
MTRDDDVSAAYKRGRTKAIGSVAQALIQQAQAGNTTAMIFYLKTQAGWRENDREEGVDVSAALLALVQKLPD